MREAKTTFETKSHAFGQDCKLTKNLVLVEFRLFEDRTTLNECEMMHAYK